jgi:hypothetical protein
MGHNVLDTLPFPAHMTAAAGQTLSSPTGDGSRVSPMATGVLDSANSPFYDNDNTSTSKFRPDLPGRIFSIVDGRNGTMQAKLLRAVQLNCSGGTSSGYTAVPGTAALVVGARPTTANVTTSQGTALQMGNTTVPATHGRFGAVAMAGGGGATTAHTANPSITNGVANTAPTAGKPAKPLYDGYTAGRILLVGDIVYVVEEGPCIVPLNSGQTATANEEAACHNDGSFRNAAANETVVGTFSLVNNSATDQVAAGTGILGPYQALLMVKRGYQDDRTGGTT